MKSLKNLLRGNEVEIMEILKGEKYGSCKFRRAVEKAYMSSSFVKYIVGNNVVFEQGSGRKVSIPVDIVEDIIGVEIQLSRRAA